MRHCVIQYHNLYFCLVAPKGHSTSGRRDLERKFPAEKREVYNGTPSDETGIEKQNFNKIEKIRRNADFQPYSQINNRNKRARKKLPRSFCFSVAPKCHSPTYLDISCRTAQLHSPYPCRRGRTDKSVSSRFSSSSQAPSHKQPRASSR